MTRMFNGRASRDQVQGEEKKKRCGDEKVRLRLRRVRTCIHLSAKNTYCLGLVHARAIYLPYWVVCPIPPWAASVVLSQPTTIRTESISRQPVKSPQRQGVFPTMWSSPIQSMLVVPGSLKPI